MMYVVNWTSISGNSAQYVVAEDDDRARGFARQTMLTDLEGILDEDELLILEETDFFALVDRYKEEGGYCDVDKAYIIP